MGRQITLKHIMRYASEGDPTAIALQKWQAGEITEGQYAIERKKFREAVYRSYLSRIEEVA